MIKQSIGFINKWKSMLNAIAEGTMTSRPKKYSCRYMLPGLTNYPNGRSNEIWKISREVMDKMQPTFIGCPIVNEMHHDGGSTPENFEEVAVGVVTDVWTDADGWDNCSFIVWDKDTIKDIEENGLNVSNAYVTTAEADGGMHNAIKYDKEVMDGEYIHLAIVRSPRQSGARINLNSLNPVFMFNANFGGKEMTMKLYPQGKVKLNSSGKVVKRTFEAENYPKDSKERKRLNESTETSEYMHSYKYAYIDENGNVNSFVSKAEADAYAEKKDSTKNNAEDHKLTTSIDKDKDIQAECSCGKWEKIVAINPKGQEAAMQEIKDSFDAHATKKNADKSDAAVRHWTALEQLKTELRDKIAKEPAKKAEYEAEIARLEKEQYDYKENAKANVAPKLNEMVKIEIYAPVSAENDLCKVWADGKYIGQVLPENFLSDAQIKALQKGKGEFTVDKNRLLEDVAKYSSIEPKKNTGKRYVGNAESKKWRVKIGPDSYDVEAATSAEAKQKAVDMAAQEDGNYSKEVGEPIMLNVDVPPEHIKKDDKEFDEIIKIVKDLKEDDKKAMTNTLTSEEQKQWDALIERAGDDGGGKNLSLDEKKEYTRLFYKYYGYLPDEIKAKVEAVKNANTSDEALEKELKAQKDQGNSKEVAIDIVGQKYGDNGNLRSIAEKVFAKENIKVYNAFKDGGNMKFTKEQMIAFNAIKKNDATIESEIKKLISEGKTESEVKQIIEGRYKDEPGFTTELLEQEMAELALASSKNNGVTIDPTKAIVEINGADVALSALINAYDEKIKADKLNAETPEEKATREKKEKEDAEAKKNSENDAKFDARVAELIKEGKTKEEAGKIAGDELKKNAETPEEKEAREKKEKEEKEKGKTKLNPEDEFNGVKVKDMMDAYNAKTNAEKATARLNTLCNSLETKENKIEIDKINELITAGKNDDEIKNIIIDERKKSLHFNALDNAKNNVDKDKPSGKMLDKDERVKVVRDRKDY